MDFRTVTAGGSVPEVAKWPVRIEVRHVKAPLFWLLLKVESVFPSRHACSGDGHDAERIGLIGYRDQLVVRPGLPVPIGSRLGEIAEALLAVPQRCVSLLALGQIEHEGDPLISAFFKSRYTDQHWHPAAVFPEVLLLEWWQAPTHLVLFDPSDVRILPFRGCQIRPSDAANDEIITIVSHNAKKRVVSLKDAAVEIPNEDSDDVRVDQAPDLRLALLEIAEETGVLQRDRRLRRQQFQDRDSIRSERVRGQRVLEVE